MTSRFSSITKHRNHSPYPFIEFILELSSNPTRLLIRCWLFCIPNLPCLLSFCCMLGGSVEVSTKNILHQFIEYQTHFSMPKHAKMSLALNEPQDISYSPCKFKHYLPAYTRSRKGILILYAIQPIKNHRGPAPDENFPLSLRITLLNVISCQTIDIDAAVAKTE